MADPAVVQRALAFRAALLRQEAAQQQVMAARWRQVERNLEESIRAVLAEIERRQAAGEVFGRHTGPYTRLERYQALLRRVRQELARFTGQVERTVAAGMVEQGLLGVEHSAALTAVTLGQPELAGQFNRINRGAVESMVAVLEEEAPVGALLRQAWPGSMVRMTEALANGVALGWNPRKTERAMREAGRSVLQRALLIARTEQLRAYRTASLANYRASGVLSGYRRLAAKSARTCLACLLADGKFFTLDVAFEEHPAGRCTMVPVLASGEAPAWETGRDWFGRQPEATQRRVMGPAAFEAWRAGAVGLDDLVERHEHSVWGGALVVRSLKKAIGEGEAKRFVDLAMGRDVKTVAIDPSALTVGEFKSIEEAIVWAKHNYKKIDWELDGLHVDAINPTLQEFDRLSKEWPEITEQIEYVGTRQTRRAYTWGKNTWAHASTDGKTIGLNPKYYSDPAELIRGLQESEDSGWHPKGTGNKIESILTHEFGHQIENWLLSQPGTVAFHAKVVGTDGLGLVYDTVAGWLNNHKATSMLSDYAVTTNKTFGKAEGWAEAFTAIRYTPKKNWTRFTKDLAELLDVVGTRSAWIRYPDSSLIPWFMDLPIDQRSDAAQELMKLRKRLGIK